MRKNVAVIFGGISCENEISVITGTMAANLIDSEKYAVYPVYIAQNGEMYTGEQLRDTAFFHGGLSDKKCPRALLSGGKLYAVRGRKRREVCAIDCALNCCHGMNGEDGAVAGLLRLNRIPDASPDMAASAVFMDKGMTKLIAKALNIPAPAFFRISEAEYKKRGAMAIKCIEERQSGNLEFASAEATQRAALAAMALPEADYFIETMLPAYTRTLDELKAEE